MNLLPKSSKEFSTKEYWNEFFSKRGDKSFEWYGEYVELCSLLLKYMKISDNILVAGCGNSSISGDLHKVGFQNITNVDISEVVIRQMREKYEEENPGMKWVRGDLLNLPFDAGEFSCVLDKGTLDALMSDDAGNGLDNSKAELYFKGVDKILRLGGRFICVSLLQEHILDKLLSWFPKEGWLMRFCRCLEAEKSQVNPGSFTHPVFMVICTKLILKNQSEPIIELNMDVEADGVNTQTHRVSQRQVREAVGSLQQFAVVRHNLQKKQIVDSEVKLELFDPKTGQVRFNLFVVDAPKKKCPNSRLPFGVFIVPHGRETEWLFKSSTGQIQLAESASANRLVVVHLMRGQQYGTMQNVQDELSSKVLELAPSKLPNNYKVPFLSVGENLGERREVFRGNSAFSGDFVVEEVKGDTAPDEGDKGTPLYFRRLIFLSNQNLVQSEAKLIRVRAKGGRKSGSEPAWGIDHSYLACNHHGVMVASLQLVPHCRKVLLVGLGGGALANFIHKYFENVHLVTVDVDEMVVQVAKKWFEFKTVPNRLECHVEDGISFIEKQEQCDSKFDVVMFDVDSKEAGEGLSCPPKQFLEQALLARVSRCLTDKGMFVLNLACRDKALKEELIRDVKRVFPVISSADIPEEINSVLFCRKPKAESLSSSETRKPENESLSSSLVSQKPQNESLSSSETRKPENESLSSSETRKPKAAGLPSPVSQKDFENSVRSINSRLKLKKSGKDLLDLTEMFNKFEIL